MIYPSLLYTSQSPLYPASWWDNPIRSGSASAVQSPLVGGTRTAGSMVENGTGRVGQIMNGANSNLYNRILLEPSSLDMGNVTSVQQRYVRLWNGYLTSKAFDSLAGENVDGITLTQPVAPPTTIIALQQLTYSLTVSTDGPATINGTFTWLVGGTAYTVAIIGRRVILLNVAPDWKNPMVEGLEWKTSVLRAYSGKEQRASLRNKARRSFEYDFTLFGLDAQKLDNALWGWQNRVFALPVWSDFCQLTNTAYAGSKLISVKTDTVSFQAGGLAVLMGDSPEVVEIDSITSTSIVLKNNLQAGWPARAVIYPLITGHLEKSVSMQRHSSQALTGKLQFLATPGDIDPYTPTASAVESYNGFEVITSQPNWSNAISWTSEFDFQTVDPQVGVLEYLESEKYPRVIRSYSWLLKSRAEVLAFRQFLARQRGQLKACWVPTWTSDFTVTRDHFASDSSFTVVPNNYRTLIAANPDRCTIMIRLRDGTRMYRTIVGVSTDGTNDVITFSSQLGVDIPKSSIVDIHLMLLSRFATDKINLEWRTNSVAVVQSSFTSIPPQ